MTNKITIQSLVTAQTKAEYAAASEKFLYCADLLAQNEFWSYNPDRVDVWVEALESLLEA